MQTNKPAEIFHFGFDQYVEARQLLVMQEYGIGKEEYWTTTTVTLLQQDYIDYLILKAKDAYELGLSLVFSEEVLDYLYSVGKFYVISKNYSNVVFEGYLNPQVRQEELIRHLEAIRDELQAKTNELQREMENQRARLYPQLPKNTDYPQRIQELQKCLAELKTQAKEIKD